VNNLLSDLAAQLKSGLQYFETQVGMELSQTTIGKNVVAQVEAQQVMNALPIIILAALGVFLLGRMSK
jgi:hypothetical protein